MDLDDFDIGQVEVQSTSSFKGSSAKDALAYIDAAWYTPFSAKSRWMDLIGDYAGSERFIIDGESLIQSVLNDDILALGRNNEPSFQIMHAFHSLECILERFLSRAAVFEIVFWHETRHLSTLTGASDFVWSSRSLARVSLIKHLHKIDIVPVHTFAGLADPEWRKYRSLKNPMFVMMNDGGTLTESPNDLPLIAECILIQRLFMFDILSQGVSVTGLEGTEFRDAKIMSFVYEQNSDTNARKHFNKQTWSVASAALKLLDSKTHELRLKVFPSSLTTFTPSNSQQVSPDNEYLLIFTQSLVAHDSNGTLQPVSKELLFVFIAHCVVLPSLSIQERARPLELVNSELLRELIDSFLPKVFLALEDVYGSEGAREPSIDGRVFISLLNMCLRNPRLSLVDVLGRQIANQVHTIWDFSGLRAVNLYDFAMRYSSPLPVSVTVSSSRPPLTVLPFDNAVFTDHLMSVKVAIEEQNTDTLPSHIAFKTVFNDTHHWHNMKRTILPRHLGGEDKKPTDLWQRSRQLRSEQRFMSTFQRQAETLTGTFGAALSRIVIPLVGSQPQLRLEKTRHPVKNQEPIAGKKGKKIHVTAADKIRHDNLAKKQAKKDDTDEVWWMEQLKSLQRSSTDAKITGMDAIQRNSRTWSGWLSAEVRLFRVHLELLRWIDDSSRDTPALRDRFTVSVMRMVKDIFELGTLSPAIIQPLSRTLAALGFSDYISSFVSSAIVVDTDRKLCFTFVKLITSKGSLVHPFMHIVESPVVWQLRLFGEFMDRSMDSQSDSRVKFKPDAWQRKVLDCLDKNHSILVVAPTSAGKTFISYYAMEQVLRESDDGILVYVAPTKALVSQIAAEVYARYSKSLDQGRSCWAIHTRDYRIHNPQNCQILITVPEMLSIMLLSPPLARVWTPRIKRIILDEIHSIGQQEGGAVWEQILLLAPCPIIGLSATIGHPQKFNDWLASVQRAHGYEHSFIHHPHRYSHLRKFSYVLAKGPRRHFSGLHDYSSTARMRFVHPISLLSSGVNMPSDFSLESSDCLSLYHALEMHDSDVEDLNPNDFFASHGPRLLRQQDILDYEEKLKDKLATDVIPVSDPEDQSSLLNRIIQELQDPIIATAKLNTVTPKDVFMNNLIFLVSDLDKSGDLPAIFFQFDRAACEKMAKNIIKTLEQAEKRWREVSPEWARKIRAWESWKLQKKARDNQIEKMKKQKNTSDDQPVQADISWESSFDENDPSPSFSFAGTSYSKAELQEEIRSLARWTSTPSWALNALCRGVGIHHSGMNKRYRTLVESLYRLGFLKIVIATGTLALGINAPTRTSVFCGDSPFLTALMYRQCAGRAGRRGFDLLGKVVFYGLAWERIQRLVLSKLPSLGGNFPMTSTMVLRLFNLLQGSDYAPVAKRSIQSLLELPQVSFVSHTGREQLLHHIRFSIDYLRRSGLLDKSGNPINLFGVAAHLYYTEPGNLALVALLHAGVFHKICQQSSAEKAKRDVVHLLSHLFGRRYLSKPFTSSPNLASIIKNSASMVVLPAIHPLAKEVLQEHADSILRVFTGYALAYTSEHIDELGREMLPLSKHTYEGDESDSSFRNHLRTTAIRAAARSVFVANSGHGDDFQTVSELARTTRTGLHLNEHAIPSMQRYIEEPGEGETLYALNAYILDFYIHGQTAALKKDNRIRPGDMWYLLQDFMLTLMTLRSALMQLFARTSDSQGDAEEPDIGTIDPAEAERGDDQSNDHAQRPEGVSDGDWKVYQIVNGVTNEFEKKFKAMWA